MRFMRNVPLQEAQDKKSKENQELFGKMLLFCHKLRHLINKHDRDAFEKGRKQHMVVKNAIDARTRNNITEIYDLLYRLGANGSYCGFFYLSYAVYLVLDCPERLCNMTKWLYPEIARLYKTNWRSVERNIRHVIHIIWRTQPALLCEISNGTILSRPTPAATISVLVAYLKRIEGYMPDN